jgi:hypothetical protein
MFPFENFLKDVKITKKSFFLNVCFIISSNYKQKNSHDVRVRISLQNVLSNSYRFIYNNLPSVHFTFMPVALWYKCASPVIGQVAICATVAL